MTGFVIVGLTFLATEKVIKERYTMYAMYNFILLWNFSKINTKFIL